MPGGVDNALALLDSAGPSSGEPMTKEEFVNYLASQMMDAGYKMNEINEIDICTYIEVMAYKMDKKEEERVNNLLF